MSSKLLDPVAKSFLASETAINASLNSSNALSLSEPTFLVFEPIFNFAMPTGLFADESYKNSALAYLKRIGESSRYEKLKAAIALLKQVMQQSPWSFESVSGIEDILKRELNDIVIESKHITFTMIESLDMRISSVLFTILECCADDTFRRVEILPKNLQEFSMGILIHEIRIFQNATGAAYAILKDSDTNRATNITATNHFLLNFGKCRFLRSSGASMMSEFSNNTVNEAKQNWDIEFKTFAKTFNFNAIANASVDQSNTSTNQSYLDTAESKLASSNINAGLVSSTVTGTNTFNNQSSALDSLKSQLSNASNRANILTALGTDKAASSLGNVFQELLDADGKLKNPFEQKRMSINAIFNTVDAYFEYIKNPNMQDVLNALQSNMSINKRKSINIYNQ